MTVTTDLIDAMSPYSLGVAKSRTAGTYTQSMFDYALQWAEDRFNRDNPGLGPNESDQAVAYLVCHYIYLSFNGAAYTSSESIGSVSKSKVLDSGGVSPSGRAKPGVSGVMTEFLAMYTNLVTLRDSRAAVVAQGYQAADTYSMKAVHLSNQRLPQMDYDDPAIIPPKPKTQAPPGYPGQPQGPIYP
jgi:hypothetical protein